MHVLHDDMVKITVIAKKHGYTNVRVDCVDVDIISDIGNRVLMVTERSPQLLRGVDYRSRHGIDLFVGLPLPNKRMFLQCLGRVGRGSDDCSRSVLRGMPTINPDSVDESDGRLI